MAFSEIRAGQVVLDLGSGAGIDLLLAAKKVGPGGRVIGIDMTDEMRVKAQQNIRAAGVGNVEVRQGVIEALPVDTASVDWVISNCVINLSPEKPRVFREIARVLRPGGQLLVSDIVAERLPEAVRSDPGLYASCIAGAISEADYLAGLRTAGLVDVAIRDRLVYDLSQLQAFFSSELEGCCGTSTCSDELLAMLPSLVGKIWSARVYARNPSSRSRSLTQSANTHKPLS